MTRRRMLLAAACAGAVLAAPGWSARLETTAHEEILAAARAARPGDVFGVALPGARPGEAWHAQYAGNGLARLLRRGGMGASLPGVVPPRFAAHIPPGAERADGYFRVVTTLRWPWWWPGGGVDWHDPRVPRDDGTR